MHAPIDRARELASGLRRVRAPNPGPMTGSGTNTYIVGDTETVVIDPGPALSGHVAAILRAAPGPIAWILVTHAHLDHSPAARELASRSGARVAGAALPALGRHDPTFTPDRVLTDGDVVETADVVLRAVHTPGHASNHLCYWHARARAVFTGDHIIDGSTVVIDPPDGDMGEYMRSLRKLRALDAAVLLPGHGEPLTEPRTAIDALIAHRERREAKVLRCVPAGRALALETLVRLVYDDVDSSLHRVATRSLLAHLLKLELDGRVVTDGGRWRRLEPAS